jgi:hypothetical protein
LAAGSCRSNIVSLDGYDTVERLKELDLIAHAISISENDGARSALGQHSSLAFTRVRELDHAEFRNGPYFGTHIDLFDHSGVTGTSSRKHPC